MKKWMIAAGFALMVLPGAMNADEVRGYASPQPSVCSDGSAGCCSPRGQCCNDDCCFLLNWRNFFCPGCWEFEGQGLYWRTCTGNRIFAEKTESDTGFDHTIIKSVKSDNDWGFRLKGKYTSCDGCRFVSLSYLYFDEHNDGHVGGGGLGSQDLFTFTPTGISAHLRPEYQRLDGRIGHMLCCGCRGAFYGYGGLSWIYIRDGESVEAFDTTNTGFLNQSSRYSAAGFEAGVGGHYYLCGRFGLAAEFGGIAAIGSRQNHFRYDDGTTNTHFCQKSCADCVPGFDLKVELFYECTLCCHNLALMIGYEQQYYFNPIELNPLFSNTNRLLIRSKDFGVAGLYVGGKVMF